MTERAAVISANFLSQKFETARVFFITMWRLNLITGKKWLMMPFGMQYYADKLTQRHTFGTWDGARWQKGAHYIDPNSTCIVPAWFSESLEMDKNR